VKNAHLSDKGIYSMIIEPDSIDETLRVHLERCRDCRRRHDSLMQFTRAYQQQIEHTEMDWAREKGRILSAISQYRLPSLWWRWGTVAVVCCIVVISALLVRQLYLQPKHDIEFREREMLTEVSIFTDSVDEVELPEGLALLTEWEREDFRQFLEYFSPIEEEGDEKEDLTDHNLSNNWADQFPVA
jgi:hypothetical protein